MANTTPPPSGGGRRLVASSDRPPARATRVAWRRRMPVVVFVVLFAATVVTALTGAVSPLPTMRFALSGHWVYNSVLRTVFHIDGGTGGIDTRAAMPGDPGSQVVQGDTSGFVVGSSRITEFGKSNLSVRQTVAPPTSEVPVGVETTGQPYLVYRAAGKVVRLGDPPATMSTGGPVGDPVLTPDGTLWLYRTDAGLICELPRDADQISSCPVVLPHGHAGALTVVGNRPAFVDTAAGRVRPVVDGRLGAGMPVGVPLSATSRPASTDVAGRTVILDPAGHRLVFTAPGTPLTVPLPPGDFDGPVSAGSSVAVVDETSSTLLTYGANGKQVGSWPIPHEDGKPRLTKGQDGLVYLEDADGTRVLIVAEDGSVQDVPVTGRTSPTTTSPPPATTQPAPSPTQPPVRTTPPVVPRPPLPASPPGAPVEVAAVAADGSATVTWRAAADNRAPITSYRITWSGGSVTVGGTARSATISGLTDGTSYVFTVAATNARGTGPSAASAPVSPFGTATAPSVSATYLGDNAATVRWTTPDLRGGTLVDYLISATGQPDRTVTGNSAQYLGLAGTVTFTVHAVTKAPGGQTVTGAGGSASVAVPTPKIVIAHGKSTSSGSCDAPDCADVNATITGFAPNTRYAITLSSLGNPDVSTESFTTDANGDAEYDQLDYDVPGETVWITVNGVRSNQIVWP